MDDRTFLDLSTLATIRARHDAGDLLDRQLDARSPSLIGEDPDIFETHQCGEDLTRVDEDEGAS